MKNYISADSLRDVLNYSAINGEFVWISSRGRVRAGDVAGTITDRGYVAIIIFGQLYKAHRLAWLYMTGDIPVGQIDHINGKRDDNRFCNLRLATNSENQQNLSASRCNKAGYLGVSMSASGRWVSCIGFDGKKKHIGTFDDPYSAHLAYVAEKEKVHFFQKEPRTDLIQRAG